MAWVGDSMAWARGLLIAGRGGDQEFGLEGTSNAGPAEAEFAHQALVREICYTRTVWNSAAREQEQGTVSMPRRTKHVYR